MKIGETEMKELIKKLEQEEGRADAYREVITMLEENNASK